MDTTQSKPTLFLITCQAVQCSSPKNQIWKYKSLTTILKDIIDLFVFNYVRSCTFRIARVFWRSSECNNFYVPLRCELIKWNSCAFSKHHKTLLLLLLAIKKCFIRKSFEECIVKVKKTESINFTLYYFVFAKMFAYFVANIHLMDGNWVIRMKSRYNLLNYAKMLC